MVDPIVIIGAGQAGLQIAEALRAESYDGPIAMIGDENRGPYHRPPLSKAFLAGEMSEAQLAMRAPEALVKKRIDLHIGMRVESIDRAARRVRLSDGRVIAYSGLAFATGARARPLPCPGADLESALYLRSLADARALRAQLETAKHVAVIGGGFIGLEVAASAQKLGRTVTVIEALGHLMARVVAPPVSEFFARLHESHGVQLALGAQVERIVGNAGRVSAVRCADGREFPADVVVVGIGVIPNDELATACGLECDRGIVVDQCSRTSDPSIVAAGDCAVQRRADGSLIRLESVQNAVEQGKSAAAALIGKERPFVASPWFWSDQYDVKLQMVGRSSGYDHVVVRGAIEERKFSAFYFRSGRLIAIDSINQSAEHLLGRKLLDGDRLPTPAQAADTEFALASLLAG